MDISDVIMLITIAAAILQIILFFKVWEMTNDVRKLREKYASSKGASFNFEIRKLLASGKKEQAKELLLNRFYNSIESLNYAGLEKSESRYEQIVKNIDDDFMKLKSELEKNLSAIGMEMPDNLKRMKSGNEFYELFK